MGREQCIGSVTFIILRTIAGIMIGIGALVAHADENVPVLRLNDAYSAPFTTPEHDGFLDIVAGRIFAEAGVRLELVRLPAERALKNANAGIDDGDLARIAGLEKVYPNLVRVPEKLLDIEFVAFGKNRHQAVSWSVLRKQTAGYLIGWKIYENKLKGSKSVLAASNANQLFELLERDRIDVALYARFMGQARLKQLGYNDIYQLRPTLASRQMFIYLHKRHAALVPKLTRALRSMKRSGRYQRELDKMLRQYSQ